MSAPSNYLVTTVFLIC